MKTTDWYKTVNKIDGYQLSCSLYAGGVASAKMYSDKILVTWSASSGGDRVKINTPVGFEVVGAHVIGHDTASDNTITVYNGANAVTDDISASGDNTVRYAGSIDKSYSEFNKDDDDLYLQAGLNGASATVVIEVVLEE